MKKLIAWTLALLMCLGLALAETTDFTGVWYLNEMATSMTVIAPASTGMNWVMTLNADGTAALDGLESPGAGTWAVEEDKIVVTLDGEPMVFTLEDGCLVADNNGMMMIFGRETNNIAGDAKADAAMEDYNGLWNAFMLDERGLRMPLKDTGIVMQIAVNNGKAVVTEGSVEEMVSAEADAAVENGMLRLTSGGADTGFALQYHSRDVLVMTQDMGDGTSMSVYFERMTEDAEN